MSADRPVRVVYASDGEKPQRMRGAVTVKPSRLRIDLAIAKRGRIREHVIEFRLYRGRPSLLPFSSWFAASLGRSLPVTTENVKSQVIRPGQVRLSIDPPTPLDFTLHIYGTEEFIHATLATFEKTE